MLAKPIYNITPFTLLDYPNHSACIFWYAGCNMRCLYCYNPEIVLGKGAITFFETISFLKTRQGLLDAVVFSGGECLMHKKIVQQIQEIKAMGFLVKIDTNGSKPAVLKQLIDENLIDYEREVKFGKYFADFIINDVVIELDGQQHELPERKASDIKKINY